MQYYIFCGTWIVVTETERALPAEDTVRSLQAQNALTNAYADLPHDFFAAEFPAASAAEQRAAHASDYERKKNNSTARDFLGKPVPALPGHLLIPIRAYFAQTDLPEGARAARAKALLTWRNELNHCARCGAPLAQTPRADLRVCPSCRKEYFPRIEPCVIVLVSKGEEILLVRHAARNQNLYTCIAGFVEIGETVEQTVAREVREETGIEITNIRYCTSQGWPFPDQLMLAFRAEYKSGELTLDKTELSEAGWFRRDALPVIPQPGAVAYRLITGAFDSCGTTSEPRAPSH